MEESDQEMAVRICGPKTRVFSGGEIQLFATAKQFEQLVRSLIAKYAGQQSASSGDGSAAYTDTEDRALQWITATIAAHAQSGETGYVESEVVDEFMKYRANAPSLSPMDQAKHAMHACAHQ